MLSNLSVLIANDADFISDQFNIRKNDHKCYLLLIHRSVFR